MRCKGWASCAVEDLVPLDGVPVRHTCSSIHAHVHECFDGRPSEGHHRPCKGTCMPIGVLRARELQPEGKGL